MDQQKSTQVRTAPQKTSLQYDGQLADSEINATKEQTEAVLPPRQPKDIWDKIAALAPIISGLMIFVMGGYFTYSYNQQQLRVQEIQTIEKFIPHLMGNEQSKKAAILAISSLTNAELAGKFAQIFASRGTVDALQSMAENGSESDKSAASTALAKALENIAARESKLNEMETAFQQALNEKTAAPPPSSSTSNSDQIAEADRLERLADMSRGRGQLSVAEALLKQAINIRIRVQLPVDARDLLASLKKLADVEQATGNKDEAENTLKKVAMIEAKLGGQSTLPPPPPPPAAGLRAESPQPGKTVREAEAVTREKESQTAVESEAKTESKSERETSAGEHEKPSGESNFANSVKTPVQESESNH